MTVTTYFIAKFVHYLVVTGPVERMKLADGTVKAEKRGDTVEIDYTLSNPDWIEKSAPRSRTA